MIQQLIPFIKLKTAIERNLDDIDRKRMKTKKMFVVYLQTTLCLKSLIAFYYVVSRKTLNTYAKIA